MKAAILAGVLALTALPAQAGDFCASVGKLSESIMTARQSGALLSDSMVIAESAGPMVDRLIRAMVVDAYGVPHYATPEHQLRAVIDFRNDVERACYLAKRG